MRENLGIAGGLNVVTDMGLSLIRVCILITHSSEKKASGMMLCVLALNNTPACR